MTTGPRASEEFVFPTFYEIVTQRNSNVIIKTFDFTNYVVLEEAKGTYN